MIWRQPPAENRQILSNAFRQTLSSILGHEVSQAQPTGDGEPCWNPGHTITSIHKEDFGRGKQPVPLSWPACGQHMSSSLSHTSLVASVTRSFSVPSEWRHLPICSFQGKEGPSPRRGMENLSLAWETFSFLLKNNN